MKICIFTTGHNALDDRIYYKQALSLKKVYKDITIIAPDDREIYYENGIKIVGVKKPNSIKERFILTRLVVEKAIEEKADIYHFHDFELIYTAPKIKKYLPNCKIIYDVHEHYPDMVSMSKKMPKILRPFAIKLVDKSEAYISKKFDYIITADDAVKERFNNFNKNVDVVYNFSEFNTSSINVDKVYDVIYQGGITIERGLMQVIMAIEKLKLYKNDIKMIFVGPFGDKDSEARATSYIRERKLANNIIFTGKVSHSDVELYIRKSRIGIVTLLPLPKYYKNIPIKQFEYMSCGIPVIGSNLPPIKKFVQKYDAGIIVDPTNVEEIAAAIKKLIENQELCSRLGANGVKAVEEEYNWSTMEEKLYKIYKSLI